MFLNCEYSSLALSGLPPTTFVVMVAPLGSKPFQSLSIVLITVSKSPSSAFISLLSFLNTSGTPALTSFSLRSLSFFLILIVQVLHRLFFVFSSNSFFDFSSAVNLAFSSAFLIASSFFCFCLNT